MLFVLAKPYLGGPICARENGKFFEIAAAAVRRDVVKTLMKTEPRHDIETNIAKTSPPGIPKTSWPAFYI
jgi:hypothetical protein